MQLRARSGHVSGMCTVKMQMTINRGLNSILGSRAVIRNRLIHELALNCREFVRLPMMRNVSIISHGVIILSYAADIDVMGFVLLSPVSS